MPTTTPARAAALASTRARLAVAVSILEGVALSSALTRADQDTVSTCITRLSDIDQRIWDEVYA